MGGGGLMRTVAKVAGVGISSSGGFRSGPSIPTGESIVSAAARQASRPVSAIVSSSNDGVSGGEAAVVVQKHVQRPSWELEEWEFYNYDDELTLKKPSSDPLPRVVFGGVPTIEEAKEATLELKDALEKVYLKSPTASTKSEDSFSVDQESDLSVMLTNSGLSDTTPFVTVHDKTVPYAVQAFKFLNEPAAQTVVSSIACDPNVWNAVLQNEELTKYLTSQRTTVSPPDAFTDGNNPAANEKFEEHLKEKESFGAGISRVVENIKCKVVDMVSDLSGFIQKTFGDFTAEKKSKDGDDKFIDTTVLGSSFLGLAVFVILMVVLKRG